MKYINDFTLKNKIKILGLILVIVVSGIFYAIYHFESELFSLRDRQYYVENNMTGLEGLIQDIEEGQNDKLKAVEVLEKINSGNIFGSNHFRINDYSGSESIRGNVDILDFSISYQTYQLLNKLKKADSTFDNEAELTIRNIYDLHIRKLNHLENRIRNVINSRNTFYFFATIALIVVLILGYSLQKNIIIRPVNRIYQQISQLRKGDFQETSIIRSKDELGMVSGIIDNFRSHIKNIAEFIQRIGEGNFNTSDLDIEKDNLLGESLFQMQQKLKLVAEEDKRRNWVNEGLARFSDILRQHNQNLQELSEDLIRNLTKYLNINQAAIFLLKNENGEEYLEATASYAWDRKKYFKKKLGLKDNLIGQSILEKDYIYMSDVPDDFVHVTSGLGQANPRAILIVPLIINDDPQGVLELASFETFEPYQIEFVKKVGENIASSIIGIKTNNQTQRLLEESQEMTSQLKKQEEILRQNTAELSDAKENLNQELEEAKRKMELQIQSIEAEKKKNIAILEGCEDGVITFKDNGVVDFFNKAAEEIWQIPREKVLGKQVRSFIPVELVESKDNLKVFYVGDGNSRPINSRTEVTIYDAKGQEISVLATLSIGKVDKESTYAFFIQRISVEFF